jgi:hypothetical protein
MVVAMPSEIIPAIDGLGFPPKADLYPPFPMWLNTLWFLRATVNRLAGFHHGLLALCSTQS